MTFITVDAIYRVNDWDVVTALMAEGVELAKNESGNLSFSFYKSENSVHLRVYFVDAEAVFAHIANCNDVTARWNDGPTEFESMRITGPKEQLELIKPKADPRAVYFETIEGGTSNIQGAPSESKSAETFIIFPIFKVNDWTKCDEEFIKPALEKVKSEKGCLYYSFAKTEDHLICRERYASANDAILHLTNVGEIIGAATAAGIIELEYAAVLATESELDKCKEAFDPLGSDYKPLVFGFERLTL